MKKRIIVTVILLLSMGMIFLGSGFTNFRTPSKGLKRSAIVRLVNPQNGLTFCSGTIVNDYTIVTAAHCVLYTEVTGLQMMNTDPIEIRNDDNIPLKVFANAYTAFQQMDTALLSGNFKAFEHMKYITNVQKLSDLRGPNTFLRSCGFPLGGPLYCNTMVFVDNIQFMWYVKGVLLPGMSGGPILLNGDTLVGINVAVDGNKSIVVPIYNLDLKFKK